MRASTRFAATLLAALAFIGGLQPQPATPTLDAGVSPAQAIELELKALQATNESAPFPTGYEDLPPLEKVRAWEQRAKDRTARGLAFIARHPDDPRRWTAALILVSNFPPYFARDFSALAPGEKPGPGETLRRWGSGSFRLVDRNVTALADFLKRREELRSALIAAQDLLPDDQAKVEFLLVVAPKIGPFYAAARRREKVDLTPVRALIADYATKFPASDYAAGLAGGYISNLENVDPAAVEAEWQFFSLSPNQALRDVAIAQLRKGDARAGLKEKPLELSFTAVDGRAVDLQALRGKVVLVDFWATWCGPCKEELPNVVANYKKYHDRGFEVIGIALENAKLVAQNTPEQAAEKLTKAKKILTDFTQQHEMPWPQYFDGKYWRNEISSRYGIDAIPAMFLIDQDGRVVSTDARGPKLEIEINRLLKL